MILQMAKFYRLNEIIDFEISVLIDKLSELQVLKNKFENEIIEIEKQIENRVKNIIHLEMLFLELNCVNWNIDVFDSAIKCKSV
jgi:hypothetical protein